MSLVQRGRGGGAHQQTLSFRSSDHWSEIQAAHGDHREEAGGFSNLTTHHSFSLLEPAPPRPAPQLVKMNVKPTLSVSRFFETFEFQI